MDLLGPMFTPSLNISFIVWSLLGINCRFNSTLFQLLIAIKSSGFHQLISNFFLKKSILCLSGHFVCANAPAYRHYAEHWLAPLKSSSTCYWSLEDFQLVHNETSGLLVPFLANSSSCDTMYRALEALLLLLLLHVAATANCKCMERDGQGFTSWNLNKKKKKTYGWAHSFSEFV